VQIYEEACYITLRSSLRNKKLHNASKIVK
jgi:hypothetical protein